MDAQAFLKRGAPAAWPHEFTVIDDPKHPLFDERMANSVTEERLRNFVVAGQIQAITARVDEKALVIVAGRQRWKRATVINHIAGVFLYKGKNPAILEAIARTKGSDLETTIVERYPNGMKLAFTVKRGDERSAALASVMENEQRDGDPLAVKIRRAQRMVSQNFSVDEIREAFGNDVTVATVKRWLAVDLSKPKTKKTRTKVRKPGAAKVTALLAALDGANMWAIATAVRWMRGEVSAKELGEKVPELAEVTL